MLTESFVASILALEKPVPNNPLKDSGIFVHEFLPRPSLVKSGFKKSSCESNCIAVGSRHVFAAHSGKAVVNVYNLETGHLETFVPFQERIRSLALACHEEEGILALGTEGGRLMLWELFTGRCISTPAAHLQAITCVATDPSFSYILTGSPDSNVNVWPVGRILSFDSGTLGSDGAHSLSPARTLSKHRGGITAVRTGHSYSTSNIAVTGSEDKTCIVWNYHTGEALHTYLFESMPKCIAIDPADRAMYTGHEDGSSLCVDFFRQSQIENVLYDKSRSTVPTQISQSGKLSSDLASPVLALETSYDGTCLISGHYDGSIQKWDIGARKGTREGFQNLKAPVTNIRLLPLAGLKNPRVSSLQPLSVVKPSFVGSTLVHNTSKPGNIPEGYSMSAGLASLSTADFCSLTKSPDFLMADFEDALDHQSFPKDFIDKALQELANPPGADARVTTRPIKEEEWKEWQVTKAAMLDMQSELFRSRAKYHELAQKVQTTLGEEELRPSSEITKASEKVQVEEGKQRMPTKEGWDSDQEMEDGSTDGSSKANGLTDD